MARPVKTEDIFMKQYDPSTSGLESRMAEAEDPVISGDSTQHGRGETVAFDPQSAETFHHQRGKPCDHGNQEKLRNEDPTNSPETRNHRRDPKKRISQQMRLLPFRKSMGLRDEIR